MAEPLQQIFEEMRARIQAELDGQVQAARATDAEAIARARQEAEADADKRWASKMEAVRFEWSARLQSEIATARAEAEKRLVAETMRIRNEADQVVAAEREQVAAQLDAERTQLEGTASPPIATGLAADRVLHGMRSIEAAQSFSDALTALVLAAAEHAPRAALFVLNGAYLDEWSVSGVARLSHQPVDLEHSGLLRTAVIRRTRVSAPGDAATAPSLALLPAGRAACAVPLTIDDEPVAVLYADEGQTAGRPEPGWADAVELLARHAASCLAQMTAVRALQLLQGGSRRPNAGGAPNEEQSARRYARLLVSEIKLYNEGAVRVGRERRDLLQRLHAEIDRARRLYEERVPATVAARASYFQEELVQTLADGDPALLGS